jgi:uncharacterized protein YbjT (DUF2867 family)
MLLITGPTGVIGRPLVEILVKEGARVRAVSRTPQTAELPAEVVGGDPSKPATIVPHLDGVTSLFLHPRAVGPAAAELLELARERGVRRVVTLSSINVDDPLQEQPSRFRGDRNREVEDATIASGLAWVSLRASTFPINTLYAWGPQFQAGDHIRGPYPTFAEAPIHDRDLAAVAAHALLHDDLLGRKIDLTGPESLTHEEMVETIGKVVGRPLRYEPVPVPAATAGMIRQGLPEELVTALMGWYERGSRQPAMVTSEVEKILGQPAKTFADWVADNAAAFSARTA